MDKAPASGAGGSEFESRAGHFRGNEGGLILFTIINTALMKWFVVECQSPGGAGWSSICGELQLWKWCHDK